MHRTQISLEKEQYELLTREARRRGVSLAALLRELVRARYPQRKSFQRTQVEALEKVTALGAGTGDAVGRKHNQFLYGRKRA